MVLETSVVRFVGGQKVRVFGLTKLGKRVASSGSDSGEEMQVLSFLRNNRSATEDELEVVGGERCVMRKLVRQGLARELTSG